MSYISKPSIISLRLKQVLFGAYSYIENLLGILLDLLPHPMRCIVFRMLLARMGSGVLIDYRTYIRYPWRLRVGSGVWINRGCEIYGSMMAGGAQITIGDHSLLAPHVKILSATHDYSRLDLPDKDASVTIGCHVWIGAGATILPGVNIGNGAVVAAGSVVTSNVAPFTIVAGNPARFLKNRPVELKTQ